MITRRSLLGTLAALPVAAAAAPAVRIGIMDGIVGLASDPEAAHVAAGIGFDSIQVTLGRPANGSLALSDATLQERWREAAKTNSISISATYLDALHVDCLRDSPLAPKWIDEGIRITQSLGAAVLMLVLFGKCALSSAADEDAVLEPLRVACRHAQDAGIVLGFENTISAGKNARILDQVNSPALKVWYDIGNSTNTGAFDVPREIRFLGSQRICEFHVKDKTWLGQGKVDLAGFASAIHDIGYRGTCTLETTATTGDRVADARKNLGILVNALHQAGVPTSARSKTISIL